MSKTRNILYIGSTVHQSLYNAMREIEVTGHIEEAPKKIDLPEPVTKYKPDIKPSGRASRRERRKNERKKRK